MPDPKSHTVRKNGIGEWFGVRIFPAAQCMPEQLELFRQRQCPFLSDSLGRATECIKGENSKGVCVITTPGKVGNRDWMVCPYRAINHGFLVQAARTIFSSSPDLLIVPAPLLAKEKTLKECRSKGECILYFQDKLGGEISLAGTHSSPEISFDLTLVRVRFTSKSFEILDYGFVELQTMDFHGSYKHAVQALKQALNLFPGTFHDEVKKNPEWATRKIEGPNIANVFKRTFYQVLLKFSLAGRSDCRGVVVALPDAVWDSWKPHLSGLSETPASDGEFVFGQANEENTWIFILKFDSQSLTVARRIRASHDELQRAAFVEAAANMQSLVLPKLKEIIVGRIRRFIESPTAVAEEIPPPAKE